VRSRLSVPALLLLVALVGRSGRAAEPPAAMTDLVEPRLTATPDLVFVTGADGTILALDARTLKEVRRWKADGLDAFAASARGDRMASAHKNAVSCGPADQAKPRWTVKIAGEPRIESLHFVAADTLAVVVGIDEGKARGGRVVLLGTEAGAEKRTITFDNDFINSAAGREGWDRLVISYQAPSGRAGEDRVALFDVGTGKRVWDERAVHGTFLGGLDPKPARVAAFALAADYEVHALDLGTGKVAAKVRVGEQFVNDPLYTPDGKYLLVRGKGETLSVIDAGTMKVVGERAWPGLQRFAVSPDGKRLYVAACEVRTSDPAKIVAVEFADFLGGLKRPK
jgi:outer membrane protein assembly factor BamB